MPRVTVLLPTFNRDRVVLQAAESVLNQSMDDFELWILDDGSTDQTIQKLTFILSDSRVRLFRLEHKGQRETLNFALSKVQTPLVAFIDSDDEWRSNHLEVLTEPFQADEQLDFVLGSFQLILPDKTREYFVWDYYRPGKKLPVSKIECVLGALVGKPDRFRSIGGFQGRLFDIDLFDRMKKAGFQWKKIDVPTYRYFFARLGDNESLKE